MVATGSFLTMTGIASAETGIGLLIAGVGIALTALGNSLNVNTTTGERSVRMDDRAAIATAITSATAMFGGLAQGAQAAATGAQSVNQTALMLQQAQNLGVLQQSLSAVGTFAQGGMQYDERGRSHGWSMNTDSFLRSSLSAGSGYAAASLSGPNSGNDFGSGSSLQNAVLSDAIVTGGNMGMDFMSYVNGHSYRYLSYQNAGLDRAGSLAGMFTSEALDSTQRAERNAQQQRLLERAREAQRNGMAHEAAGILQALGVVGARREDVLDGWGSERTREELHNQYGVSSDRELVALFKNRLFWNQTEAGTNAFLGQLAAAGIDITDAVEFTHSQRVARYGSGDQRAIAIAQMGERGYVQARLEQDTYHAALLLAMDKLGPDAEPEALAEAARGLQTMMLARQDMNGRVDEILRQAERGRRFDLAGLAAGQRINVFGENSKSWMITHVGSDSFTIARPGMGSQSIRADGRFNLDEVIARNYLSGDGEAFRRMVAAQAEQARAMEAAAAHYRAQDVYNEDLMALRAEHAAETEHMAQWATALALARRESNIGFWTAEMEAEAHDAGAFRGAIDGTTTGFLGGQYNNAVDAGGHYFSDDRWDRQIIRSEFYKHAYTEAYQSFYNAGYQSGAIADRMVTAVEVASLAAFPANLSATVRATVRSAVRRGMSRTAEFVAGRLRRTGVRQLIRSGVDDGFAELARNGLRRSGFADDVVRRGARSATVTRGAANTSSRAAGVFTREINGTTIIGRAQSTGTPGHAFRSYREAVQMARSGQYETIYLNRGYNKAFYPRYVSPNRRPDVLGIRRTGRVDAIEVPSRTDIISDLIRRNEEIMRRLPLERRGQVLIREIQ